MRRYGSVWQCHWFAGILLYCSVLLIMNFTTSCYCQGHSILRIFATHKSTVSKYFQFTASVILTNLYLFIIIQILTCLPILFKTIHLSCNIFNPQSHNEMMRVKKTRLCKSRWLQPWSDFTQWQASLTTVLHNLYGSTSSTSIPQLTQG